MMNTRKIFIGSSSEALKMAERVGDAVKEAGMEPLMWNTKFPAGYILLEAIEKLPSEVDGAVLLMTPDICCKRGEVNFDAPVANVVFEYGYLAASLTRRRVAICQYEDTNIPSDIEGLTVVSAGKYEKYASSPLSEDAKTSLENWLNQLPLLAHGIPSISRVHGYSGMWEIENRFSRWRDIELGENDKVYFEGSAFLLIPVHGKKGVGTQTGKLYISASRYEAEYKIANRILEATVDEGGTLKMRVEVLSRELIKEKNKPEDPRFTGDLSGSKTFDLELRRAPGESKVLRGVHEYRTGIDVHSRAEEVYRYSGL